MITLYRPNKFSTIVAYMLQNTEYQPLTYLKWLLRTRKLNKIMYRRTIEQTKAARTFKSFVLFGMIQQYILATLLLLYAINSANYLLVAVAVLLLLTAPLMWAIAVTLPLILARLLISNPKQKRLIAQSKQIFLNTKAVKIAVAGSYGKTSMKEMLGTVLGEAINVAITPANKNVAISHAIFARKLTGNEQALIVEFGEGTSGDVQKFSDTFGQNITIITGIAPAHLDGYASLDEAAKDIFTATTKVDASKVYVNGESILAKDYIKPEYKSYTRSGLDGLKVGAIDSSIAGVNFMATTRKATYEVKSSLLGQHNIGPLCTVIAIAEQLGISAEHVQAGIQKIKAYEHRMQPRQLASGAWIIDDTYNGNIEGMQAGLKLLTELPAARKVYITPGLVDQGTQTEAIHMQLGNLIAQAQPDVVVLMKNSVTNYIKKGIDRGSFKGELIIEDDPLNFYTNIEQFAAGGDLIVMQNDWPDNYN